MTDTSEQIRKTLEALDKPEKFLQKHLSVLESPGMREARKIGKLMSAQTTELAKIGDTIARSTTSFDKLYLGSMISRAEIDRLTNTFFTTQAEIDKLARPFGLDKAELEKLTNPLASQIAELEKLRKSISDFGKPVTDFEEMFAASRKQAEELSRALSQSTIGHALKAFEWKDLRATIAAANEAMESSAIQIAMGRALEVPAADEADSVAAFSSFAQGLFQKLSPEIAYPLIAAILIALVQPFWDYYVKEILLKPAATGDQRVLSKEIEKLNVEPIYAATRRVVLKSMNVRMNPRTNSPLVGQVVMGELVELVKSEKDWTQIIIRGPGGKSVTGWVFTRHLKPLN